MDFRKLSQDAEKALELDLKTMPAPWISGNAGGSVIAPSVPPKSHLQEVNDFYGKGELVCETAGPAVQAYLHHVKSTLPGMAKASIILSEIAHLAKNSRNSDALVGMVLRQKLGL